MPSSGVVGSEGLLSAADTKAGLAGGGGSAGSGSAADGEGGPEEKARASDVEDPNKIVPGVRLASENCLASLVSY